MVQLCLINTDGAARLSRSTPSLLTMFVSWHESYRTFSFVYRKSYTPASTYNGLSTWAPVLQSVYLSPSTYAGDRYYYTKSYLVSLSYWERLIIVPAQATLGASSFLLFSSGAR